MKFALCALVLFLAGCSSVMAVKQERKKDVGLLVPGSPRGLLIAEFGAPVHTETKDSKRVDIFSFNAGVGKGAKAGRAAGHAFMSLMTLGTWEIVGMPAEAVFDGKDVVAEVTYLPDSDRVESVKWLKKK